MRAGEEELLERLREARRVGFGRGGGEGEGEGAAAALQNGRVERTRVAHSGPNPSASGEAKAVCGTGCANITAGCAIHGDAGVATNSAHAPA